MAKNRTERLAQSPWIEHLGRFGYSAKATVYLTIGALAFAAAAGRGGRTTGSSGALIEILRQPFGRVLLAVVTLGLFAYVAWRLLQIFFDTGESRAHTIAKRVYRSISAVMYGTLATTGARLVLGMPEGADPPGLVRLLVHPAGRAAAGLIGAGVTGAGVYHAVRAFKATFRRKLVFDGVGRRWAPVLVAIGRVGLWARAVVYMLIGSFLVRAAWTASSHGARGLEETLDLVRAQIYGGVLLGALAVGLLAYGLYQLIKARFGEYEITSGETGP